MIRIRRPITGPPRLKAQSERQTALYCDAYATSSADYHSGAKRFKYPSFSDGSTKRLLFKMHYGKCCYCERKLDSEYLHVEHFRPKGGARQSLAERANM